MKMQILQSFPDFSNVSDTVIVSGENPDDQILYKEEFNRK